MTGRFVVRANGIRLHCVQAGTGPLILLLHGFPELSYAWRRQLPALAAAGFRAVAPDLRGYGRSDRPPGVAAYAIETLVDDVAGLIEALGERDAVLVGHDWGGVIAWYAAMLRPASVRRLVILNAPHPAAYAREVRRLSSQVWRSWYAAMHQIPWLPEVAWRTGDFALLRRVLRAGPARTREEMAEYVSAFSEPGAITAALNYYRAALRHRPRGIRLIHAPTLLIWGERDRFLVPQLAEGLDRWVPDITAERLPQSSHWLHHEEPERVSELIAGFARPPDGTSDPSSLRSSG